MLYPVADFAAGCASIRNLGSSTDVDCVVQMAMDLNSEELSDSFDFDDDDDDDEGSFSSSWMDHRESAQSSMHPTIPAAVHDDRLEATSGPAK